MLPKEAKDNKKRKTLLPFSGKPAATFKPNPPANGQSSLKSSVSSNATTVDAPRKDDDAAVPSKPAARVPERTAPSSPSSKSTASSRDTDVIAIDSGDESDSSVTKKRL